MLQDEFKKAQKVIKKYICTYLVICTETILKIKASHLNKGRWMSS